MNTDLNKKTVKELRKRVRELHEEGVIDETLTEISKARKAELIEWIEFYDDEDEDYQENWRPDIAVLLVFVSGLLSMAAYFEIKS